MDDPTREEPQNEGSADLNGPVSQGQSDVPLPLIPGPQAASGEAPRPAQALPEVVYAPPASVVAPKGSFFARIRDNVIDYVTGRDPTLGSLFWPLLIVSLILFTRSPATNYIFDEQEALLANPYVNAQSGLKFIDAIHRDFWGLPADRSVGSYRPIPDFLWRALWSLSKKSDGIFRHPFIHHIYNVVFHALNGAVLGRVTFAWTRRRELAYAAGFVFVMCAVLTEAVSGIVGIADVLGGLGALCALAALSLPGWAMPFAVFTAVIFGLFCKESAVVCVPLVPFAALLLAPLTHPERPARAMRTLLALVGAGAAFYLYVELRKRWFLSPLPSELKVPPPEGASFLKRTSYEFLVWFHQAPLPKDPLNNPLAEADTPHRIAGALRVYFRGLTQIVFPKTLSGDYSYPQEPTPDKLVFPESVLGAALMALPPLGSLVIWLVALWRERGARREEAAARAPREPTDQGHYREIRYHAARAPVRAEDTPARRRTRIYGLSLTLLASLLVAIDVWYLRPKGLRLEWRALPATLICIPLGIIGVGLTIEGLPRLPAPSMSALGKSGLILVGVGLTWVVVSYFPHSNIPVVLPTVRAERFWYFPAIGTTLILAVVFALIHQRGVRWQRPWLGAAVFGVFILFQGVQAYRHAMDYRNDLDFWEATKKAVPNSAKAHLNYSVMKGARRDMQTRLEESKMARQLAPKWPMAHIYTGDTLCRMNRAKEAWPYYKDGFNLGPNDLSLIALALQCLYDEKELMAHEEELRDIAAKHEGTWIAYLAIDTLNNHEKHKGVDPKYRPRGYNEGPKD